MTDILKRNLAPITDEAWSLIDEQAKRILKGNLSARGLVDVSGPHGWTFAAVNLGKLDAAAVPAKDVAWGLRRVLPLVEIRVPFTLGTWDLDNVGRGSKTPELGAVDKAAQAAAYFEEQAVYRGFKDGDIRGIVDSATHKAVALPKDATDMPAAVEDAVSMLRAAGIGGPYALVLNRALFRAVEAADKGGHPIRGRVLDIVGGGVHWSPAVDGGVVLSRRGGDFELTIGQDLSIGYQGHSDGKVELYLTESFTFRAIEPTAAVELRTKG